MFIFPFSFYSLSCNTIVSLLVGIVVIPFTCIPQKLAVGGLPEKILSAFQSVFDENANEEGAFNNCRGVVSRVKEMEQEIEKSSFQGEFWW